MANNRILGSIDVDPIHDDEAGFLTNNAFWHVSTLLRAVKNQGCEKFKHYLASCYFSTYSKSTDPLEMAKDYRRIQHADLDAPIILCPWGEVVDGGHRVAKALVEGRDWLWAYRLKSMPKADREETNA